MPKVECSITPEQFAALKALSYQQVAFMAKAIKGHWWTESANGGHALFISSYLKAGQIQKNVRTFLDKHLTSVEFPTCYHLCSELLPNVLFVSDKRTCVFAPHGNATQVNRALNHNRTHLEYRYGNYQEPSQTTLESIRAQLKPVTRATRKREACTTRNELLEKHARNQFSLLRELVD